MSEQDAGSDGAAPGTDSPAAAGLRIRHLPPLCFRLRFPRGYPSTQPPECSLSALWLSAANAATLSAELTRLWDEQVGVARSRYITPALASLKCACALHCYI